MKLAEHREDATKTIYVVGHGWHTGLVLKTADVASEIWPEILDFEDSDFVEIGWGDEGFYRAKQITPKLVLRAAFWPTPSVLHIVGFRGSVQEFYQVSDIVAVEISERDFEQLCRYTSNTFERDGDGLSKRLGPGIYGDSYFYRAREKYYVPKTCNVWTARALRAAGLPIIPGIALTAENVLRQTGRSGRVLQRYPSGLKRAALRGEE